MIVDGGLVPELVAARFCQDTIFGIGRAVREFLELSVGSAHLAVLSARVLEGNGE